MIRRSLVGLSLLVACLIVFHAAPVSAASLKISPLRYDASLLAGEKKKGFVDVTNPSAESIQIKLSVQAFRQTDNSGSLEFYDNPTVSSGILLDLEEADLGPRETLHLAFILDGAKLASGDNFAAIFASTVPNGHTAGEQAVRVGTLFIINNGTASDHNATVEDLSGQLFQFGDGLSISFNVHNTAKEGAATGFSPTITVRAWPYISDTVSGPLVFAGRTRSVEYTKKGDYLGILQIRVKTGTSEQVMYRVAITGFWRLLVPILVLAIVITLWFSSYVRKHFANSSKSTPVKD